MTLYPQRSYCSNCLSLSNLHLKYKRVKPEKSDVVELLRGVRDPLAGVSLVDAHRIRDVEIKDNRIQVVLVFTQNLTQEQKSSVYFA